MTEEEKILINDYIKAYKAFYKKIGSSDNNYEYVTMQSAAIALCTKKLFPYQITFKQLYEECLKKKNEEQEA